MKERRAINDRDDVSAFRVAPRRAGTTRHVGLVSSAVLSMLLTACIGPKYPPPPAGAEGDAELPVYDYVIGEGDVLNIFVWGYNDLSVSVPVRPDGRITTRLVEDLQAAGRTPTELAREIEKRYVDYVNRPVVTISVDEFVGAQSQQVKIIGASSEPRTVSFESDMTVLDLLIEVGGLGEFASGNRARLVREHDGVRSIYSLRLDDLVRKGDMSADVLLRPGDIVVVPESWF